MTAKKIIQQSSSSAQDEEAATSHFTKKPSSLFLFFPEAPIAAILLMGAPVWAIYLVRDGHYLHAVGLMVGVTCFGYAAYRAIRANDRPLAYLAVAGIIVVGVIVGNWL